MEIPALRYENGCTLADVVVNLDQGFHSLRGSTVFTKDCMRYEFENVQWVK